jgi:hypothetical protein
MIVAEVREAMAEIPTPKDGKDGRDGRDGVNGKDGTDGLNGRDGVDGKDALQVEPLQAIDFSKSYSRGTWAIHKNGLWRAYQQTDNEHGWVCVVNGLDAVDLEQNDLRSGTLTLSMSNGGRLEKSILFPGLQYRDVYREEIKYTVGDTVTFGGSLWHCNQDGVEGVKPGTVEGKDAWTLCVKKGRDK